MNKNNAPTTIRPFSAAWCETIRCGLIWDASRSAPLPRPLPSLPPMSLLLYNLHFRCDKKRRRPETAFQICPHLWRQWCKVDPTIYAKMKVCSLLSFAKLSLTIYLLEKHFKNATWVILVKSVIENGLLGSELNTPPQEDMFRCNLTDNRAYFQNLYFWGGLYKALNTTVLLYSARR